MLKWLRVVVAALFVLGVAALFLSRPPSIGALVERPDIEACLLAAVAAERSSDEAPALPENDELVAAARRHASSMAADGELRHSNLREIYGASWKLVGENVAMNADTSTCAPMAAGLAGSARHHANTVDRRWSFAGAGAVEVDGILWAAVAFAQPHGSAPVVTTPITPAPPPTTRPPLPPALRSPCSCPPP